MTTDEVLTRLAERGLALPDAPAPAGNYVPLRIHGEVGYLAGQFPMVDGKPAVTGRVGAERTLEEGRRAAEISALNVLAQIRSGLGGFERLVGLIRVEGHVASARDFDDQPGVLDGASELFLAVLGDRGIHARTAFSPFRLPWDLTVELVVTFAVASGDDASS